MSASYPELQRLINEILSIIQGARVVNLYHMEDDSIILKIRSEDFAGELRIVPGRFLYLTEGSYEKPKELTRHGRILRSLLVNARIRAAELLEGERIVIFHLERGEKKVKLVCEFLPRGTVLVSDEDDVILEALHHLEMRDRRIAPGERYIRPPPKQSILTGLVPQFLEKLSHERSIVSALAAEAGLGGRYAEEVLHLAGIDPSKKVKELSREEFEKLYEATQRVLNQVMHGPPVVAFSPEGEVQALPYPMESLSSRKWKFKEVASLNEAFRVAYEHDLAKRLNEERVRAVKEKISDLEKRANERGVIAQKLLKESEALREIAEKLFQSSPQIEEIIGKTGRHEIGDIIIDVDAANEVLKVKVGEKYLEFSSTESFVKQVSKLFDDAKKTANAAKKLLSEVEEIEREVERLRKSVLEAVEMTVVKVSARIRSGRGKWYERYRWFITSEGFLAVAGKDASSNISLLKKHLEPSDLVFHAEVRGAAVVVLKNGKEAGEASRNEAAQFAAIYSRAWKEGFSQMTVYYVEPHQVSFTPPPGHYLPKGGFIIKGERKYLTVKLELAIGLSENLEVVYGPPEAVSKNIKNFIKLVPGDKKAGELANEIIDSLCRELNIDAKTLRDLKLAIAELIPYGRGEIMRNAP
ncbi:MAG: ribosome rescue protein RqcH [Nitrososphaerota archaeon]|nr:ribosome rescue protein RqcH [Nitrososphaerota archaeon]